MSEANNVEQLPQQEDLIDSCKVAAELNSTSIGNENDDSESISRLESISTKSSNCNDSECVSFVYSVGELFWGRVFTYCYWPCIVCSDPDSKRTVSEHIFQHAGHPAYSVHVRFFADNGRRFWIPHDNLQPFTNMADYYKLIEDAKNVGKIRAFLPTKKNKVMWQKAVDNASYIATLPTEERLNAFFRISVLDKIKTENHSSDVLSASNSSFDLQNDASSSETGANSRSKRKRTISQSSSMDSLNNKNLAIKRPRFKHEPGFNNRNHTHHYSDLYENPTHMLSENLPNGFGGEFDELFAYIKGFIMGKNSNESIESRIHVIVRQILTLRELNSRQNGQNGNTPSTSKEAAKRLSNRVKHVNVKKKSSSSSMEENKTIISLSPNSSIENNMKRNVKPIMAVVNDIFALDVKYLFWGVNREAVCTYCFRAGKNLKKCSKCLQTWMHSECLQAQSTPPPLPNRKHRRKHWRHKKPPELDGNSQAAQDDDSLICKECEIGRLICFVCKRPEDKSSDANDDPLITCSVSQCNAVYHLHCCKYWPQAKILMTKDGIESFRCPSHVCHTCASDDPKSNFEQLSANKIVKCMKCPATYHSDSTCIPAGSQILTTACIICPRHSILKRDKNVNVNWCFICVSGGKLVCCENCPNAVHEQCLRIPLDATDGYICEECESGRMPLYGEIVWAKYNSYRWWPSIILPPPEVPQNVVRLTHAPSDFVVRFLGTHNHGWISRRRVYLYVEGDAITVQKRRSATEVDVKYICGVEEAEEIYDVIKNKKLESHATNKIRILPQPYVKIKSNRPVPPVKLRSNTEVNKCECQPTDDDPCGPNSSCINRVLYHECNPNICPAGRLCQNQMFGARQSPRLDTIYTQERGFDLVTREPIPKGSFIIEYVGEVINDEEFRNRLSRKFRDRDKNFYFLCVEKDYIIDSDRKGNLARFINHSCDPNSQMQKWSVNAINRVGIFAIKDIPADTELTFNYHWDDLLGNEKKTCYCGAKACTGFIGGKIKRA